MMRRILAAVIAALLIATPAAAKAVEVTGTITLDQPLPVALGDTVTFTTTIDGHVTRPEVEVHCSQDGVLVFGIAGAPDDAFLLGGGTSQWVSGPADCEAVLFYFGRGRDKPYTALAATTFPVEG